MFGRIIGAGSRKRSSTLAVIRLTASFWRHRHHAIDAAEKTAPPALVAKKVISAWLSRLVAPKKRVLMLWLVERASTIGEIDSFAIGATSVVLSHSWKTGPYVTLLQHRPELDTARTEKLPLAAANATAYPARRCRMPAMRDRRPPAVLARPAPHALRYS